MLLLGNLTNEGFYERLPITTSATVAFAGKYQLVETLFRSANKNRVIRFHNSIEQFEPSDFLKIEGIIDICKTNAILHAKKEAVDKIENKYLEPKRIAMTAFDTAKNTGFASSLFTIPSDPSDLFALGGLLSTVAVGSGFYSYHNCQPANEITEIKINSELLVSKIKFLAINLISEARHLKTLRLEETIRNLETRATNLELSLNNTNQSARKTERVTQELYAQQKNMVLYFRAMTRAMTNSNIQEPLKQLAASVPLSIEPSDSSQDGFEHVNTPSEPGLPIPYNYADFASPSDISPDYQMELSELQMQEHLSQQEEHIQPFADLNQGPSGV